MPTKGWRKNPPKLIYCACGCGEQRLDRDKKGRLRFFINTHQHRGRKFSKKWRENISRGGKRVGLKHRYWLNKKRLNLRKENKSKWKEFRKQLRERTEYQQWIRAVFKRDNYTCQFCGETRKYLNAHHLKPFKDYPHLGLTISNGLTLCRGCHFALHSLLKIANVEIIK